MGVNNQKEESWWTEDTEASQISRYFDPKDISVDIRNESIDSLLRKIESGDIDLLPNFQRKFDLWTDESKSQFIESILLNFPIPPLYFDSNTNGNRLVIDGLQRLWTLKKFVVDNGFSLKGLSVLRELNGFRFEELPRQVQRRIFEYSLVTYLMRPGAPRFVIYDIFRRLNTGGVTLNAQEIRHALNPTSSSRLETILQESHIRDFIRISSKRMQDHELVLRYTAFYLRPYQSYQPPMSSFLDKTMEYLKDIDAELIAELTMKLTVSLNFLIELLGRDAFSKSLIEPRNRKFNKALFEVWTVSISRLNMSDMERISNNRNALISRYHQLLLSPAFSSSISVTTASRQSVNIRFEEMSELLNLNYDN